MDRDVENLISLVRNRPGIYNNDLPEHSNKAVVQRLWDEVAMEMGLAVSDCKSKWASLRNSYARALRNASNVSGSMTKKKKMWYLEPAMSFLRDYMHLYKSSSSNNGDAEDEETTGFAEDAENVVDEPVNRKPPSKQVSGGLSVTFLESRTQDQQEDANMCFLKSLLPDMNKLTQSNLRKFKENALVYLNRLLDSQEQSQEGIQHTPFIVCPKTSPTTSSLGSNHFPSSAL